MSTQHSLSVIRFLIAALHVQALEDCDTVKAMKGVVDTLPTELSALYERTIERILRLKPERGTLGLMALLWVTFAKRRLSLQELQYALATHYVVGSFEVGQFDLDAIPDKAVILAASCGLLTVDASGDVRLTRAFFSPCTI